MVPQEHRQLLERRVHQGRVALVLQVLTMLPAVAVAVAISAGVVGRNHQTETVELAAVAVVGPRLLLLRLPAASLTHRDSRQVTDQ